MKLLLLVSCIGYIGWPFPDFIPDATPFVGTLDDGLAGAIAGQVLRKMMSGGK